YNLMWDYISTQEDLRSLMAVNEEEGIPFYIPEESMDMTRWSLTVNMVDPNIMKDALFNNPSIVGRNLSKGDEVYYTDAQRGMRVYENRRVMEFANPYEAASEPDDPVTLLDLSMSNINDQKGWTDDFRLLELDQANSKIVYQMFYQGFPVYDMTEMTQIEQQWRNQNLYEYTRPLFQIDD